MKKCQNLCHVKSIKEKEHLGKSKFLNSEFASISNFHFPCHVGEWSWNVYVELTSMKWGKSEPYVTQYSHIMRLYFERKGICCVAKNEKTFFVGSFQFGAFRWRPEKCEMEKGIQMRNEFPKRILAGSTTWCWTWTTYRAAKEPNSLPFGNDGNIFIFSGAQKRPWYA